MNLFDKYGIFVYTYTTRFPSFRAYKNYLISNVLFPLLPLFYIYGSQKDFNGMIYMCSLYIIYFYIFGLFYEIGYIWNDYFGIKKEKYPTIRIHKKIKQNIIIFIIIKRLFLGMFFLFILYFAEPILTQSIVSIICLMGIIFSIHNFIRNYFVNLITIFLLKTSRFLIIITILEHLDLHNLVPIVFMYFFIDSLVEIILNNNMRVNLKQIILDKNNIPATKLPDLFFYKLPDLFFHSSMIFFCIVSFYLTHEPIHLVYLPYYICMVGVEFVKFSYNDFNRC